MAQSPKTRRKNKLETEEKLSISQTKTPATYDITMSQVAGVAYEGFYQRAAEARDRGELTSYHYTALNMIDEVIERIIPQDPFKKDYALQGGLTGIFRIQKGRLRICWMGSSVRRKVCVLFISETLRKQGDANDPYRILTGMVMSGQFNEIFQALGVTPPPVAPFIKGGYLPN
jgi:hypothetical protein